MVIARSSWFLFYEHIHLIIDDLVLIFVLPLIKWPSDLTFTLELYIIFNLSSFFFFTLLFIASSYFSLHEVLIILVFLLFMKKMNAIATMIPFFPFPFLIGKIVHIMGKIAIAAMIEWPYHILTGSFGSI